MQIWTIDLWETPDAVCRVKRDLLKGLGRKESYILASLREKMTEYTQVPTENLKQVGDLEKVKSEKNMWELKFHLPKNQIRFLGCLTLESGFSRFYALYAFKKKDQSIKNKHRETARERVKEFINYYQQNGFQKIL